MSDLAIRADRLGKAYRIGLLEERHETLFSALASFVKAPWSNLQRLRNLRRFESFDDKDVLWALRDVSFDLHQGEAIGIIGPNGAGKSTLLKILSRVTEPTQGAAYVYGRVGSLLEVGTGFHPDLTGRENVYLNGTILGMKKREIDARFDEIVEFAGVERFIDTPVKRYSSGMRVRLAFSVAAHLEPEILVVDEVLAVGDASFQKKCLGKMEGVSRSGRTILFVSHNMGAISALCSRVLVIDHGQVVCDADPQKGIAEYMSRVSAGAMVPLAHRKDRRGNKALQFVGIRFRNGRGEPVDTLTAGDDLTVELDYDLAGGALREVVFQVAFLDAYGQILFVCLTRTVNSNFPRIEPDSAVRCVIPRFPLAPGNYYVTLMCKENGTALADRVDAAAALTVAAGDFFGTGRVTPEESGPFMVPHRWGLVPRDRAIPGPTAGA